MENHDLRTLRILEAVDDDQTITQRDLSKKLNISLGLVNSFIKRLVNKGFFKITTIPKNRVRYILTPKGAAEKTRLTYEYLQYSLRFYRESRRKIKTLFKSFEQQGVKRILLYGIGDLAEIAYLSMQETDLELVGIIAEKAKGKKFFNLTVSDNSGLKQVLFDKSLIDEDRFGKTEINRFKEMGVEPTKIHVVI
jgi:DNA-binding MarR family transcriptional regulator